MEKGIEKIEEILDTVKLREFAKGTNGEFVTLVDIQHTKSLLKKQAEKYKDLVITEENYKKEGAAAERELRESRLALSKIHKSNNSILNQVKRDEKETYESLIEIVQPGEVRLKTAIVEIEDKVKIEKERKRKLEEERVDNIKKELEKEKSDFESMISKGRSKEDLVSYNQKLDSLEERFEGFGEFKFEAERIHAIFTGRRKELEKQISDFEELERNKIESEKKKKEEEEFKNQILELRISELVERGFEHIKHLSVLSNKVSEITENDLKSLSELEWFNKKKEFIERFKESEKQKEKQLSERWESIVSDLRKINVNVKDYELKEGQVVTEKQIQDLKDLYDLEKQKTKVQIAKSVLSEIDPFKNEILRFISSFEKKINSKDFKQAKSKEILTSLVDSIEKDVNDILGSEINK